jgi:predicted Zn-dependent peptidase
MEAERMRSAIINQIGVDTQREVVKEEKRMRIDNAPYGNYYRTSIYHIFLINTHMEDLLLVLWKI